MLYKGTIMQLNQFENSQLKEFYLKAKIDVELIESNILVNKERYDGCESNSAEQGILSQISSYAKETYNVEVTSDIAGMESLVEKLKEGLKQVISTLSGKQNKQQLSIIKNYGHQADEAAKLYKSDKWLNDQTFINIGNTKFKTLSIFSDVKTIDDVKKIIEPIIKKCEGSFESILKETEKRLSTGLSIYNKYKNKKHTDDLVKEIEKLLPINPEIKSINKDEFLSLLGTGYVTSSIPVLTKDKVRDVTILLTMVAKFIWDQEERREKVISNALAIEEYWDGDFWSEVPDKVIDQMLDATEWQCIEEGSFKSISDVSRKITLELAKFLENWILYSVK